MAIVVFGKVDRDRDGKIRSEFPAWYWKQQIDELSESVAHKERMLERDLVPASEKPSMREKLKMERERMEEINASKPKPNPQEKDQVTNLVKELGKDISEAMFTRTDMEKGLADAHEEARRMADPIMEIKTKEEAEFARQCGIKVYEGKISRSDKEKMWKIGRRIVEESSNTELLRKDRLTVSGPKFSVPDTIKQEIIEESAIKTLDVDVPVQKVKKAKGWPKGKPRKKVEVITPEGEK